MNMITVDSLLPLKEFFFQCDVFIVSVNLLHHTVTYMCRFHSLQLLNY